MSRGLPAEPWLTPDVISAQRQLDAAVEGAVSAIRHADVIEEAAAENDKPVTEDDIETFREFVTGPGRTPEWDAIGARIAGGEVTWRAVLEGDLAKDSGLAEALASMPRCAYEDLVSGGELSSASEPPGSPSSRPARSHRNDWDDDDDFYENFSIGRW